MGELLQKKEVSIQVLSSSDSWFGVTYPEDKEMVVKAFTQLVRDGVYCSNLWEK